uniref:Saposin B-type domain-containing protein n=1 Tax=Panagrolaimus sp. JU765 TaxID=591449 RepID=A0AC34QV61_9BILA
MTKIFNFNFQLLFLCLLLGNLIPQSFCTFSSFFATEQENVPVSNSIIETETIDNNRKTTSNLGCFLCAQLLTVTKQRVGLSQTQLRIVLNDRCTQLPTVFRSQCFAFVSDSLPQIYVSLTYDMPVKNLCELLKLCDPNNPFINERLIEETIDEKMSTTTTTTTTTAIPNTIPTKSYPSYPFPMSTTMFPPMIGNELTSPSPFEERRRPYPMIPDPNNLVSGPSTPDKSIDKSEIPDFKELASKTGGLPSTTNINGPDGKKSKRLTCLFCERMLNNAKSYAISAKSEISAFANATCSKITEPELAEQCFQLTDRKINELAVFVDEQVVEALWCAQLNHC